MNAPSDAPVRSHALKLGSVSFISYLFGYYLRNLLSVATPEMLSAGTYSAEWIGLLSSVFLFVYAAGQLVNGFIGDRIPVKYMVLCGLFSAGLANFIFPFTNAAWLQMICFVFMGLGLSMLRGPISKMVSESLPQRYAQFICMLLSVASSLGPLLASLLAMLFHWHTMFLVAGSATMGTALFAFLFLSAFERKGMLQFHSMRQANAKEYLGLWKVDGFLFYLFIGGVVEIASFAITFWIPAYLSDALKFDNMTTNTINAVIAVSNTVMPFLTLLLYRLLRERALLLQRGGFLLALLCFMLMLLTPWPFVKGTLLLIGKSALAVCAAVLWSIYIPGMSGTGKVSGINGAINCFGYLAAAGANALFAHFVGANWNLILALWGAIALCGLLATCIRTGAKTM